MNALRPITSPVSYPDGEVERLRGGKAATLEREKARLRKAAKEFESLFMYQMLKVMRQTVGESSMAEGAPMGGSLGKDTFMDMFDVEMAREMVTGGNGSIADILYQRLEKTVTSKFDEGTEPVRVRPLEQEDRERKAIQIQGPELPLERPGMRPIEVTPRSGEPVSRQMWTSASHSSPPPVVKPVTESVSAGSVFEVGEVKREAEAVDPIRRRFGRWIDEAAEVHRVDSTLIRAVIETESGGNPRAVSKAGAKGLMQLMDGTAAEMGTTEPFNARENIMSGTKYLRRMIDRFGDLKLALAAYNAGPGTVERHGGVPPYAETIEYVEKVLDSVRTHESGEARFELSKGRTAVSR